MNYSVNIINWFALAPGLSSQQEWQTWAGQDTDVFCGEIAKYQKIPMMAARRMSVPSRLAVETGLNLLEQSPLSDCASSDKENKPIDSAIFISRHGELERTYKIVAGLAQQSDISPTDFAMSVHNTAAGLFTITAKQALPIASLAAGIDGFQQGMLEAQAMLAAGAERILLIDFDGLIPDPYHNAMDDVPDSLCYAAGFIISAGQQMNCQQIVNDRNEQAIRHRLPQSLLFLKNWLNGKDQFVVQGVRSHWQWKLYR